ncbi:MAG TPA: hypothetical protein ENI63_00660 [Candidatus Kaiserbacteria bacterium]|nr:hypothetical protein [Candidatus Kaiserbacteria bacterium]
MTKRNPVFHRQRQRKRFHIPELPRKPIRACDLEKGDHIRHGCHKKAPIRPEDYLPKGDGFGFDCNEHDLTELIKK